MIFHNMDDRATGIIRMVSLREMPLISSWHSHPSTFKNESDFSQNVNNLRHG